jgi:hypothetical protein
MGIDYYEVMTSESVRDQRMLILSIAIPHQDADQSLR